MLIFVLFIDLIFFPMFIHPMFFRLSKIIYGYITDHAILFGRVLILPITSGSSGNRGDCPCCYRLISYSSITGSCILSSCEYSLSNLFACLSSQQFRLYLFILQERPSKLDTVVSTFILYLANIDVPVSINKL